MLRARRLRARARHRLQLVVGVVRHRRRDAAGCGGRGDVAVRVVGEGRRRVGGRRVLGRRRLDRLLLLAPRGVAVAQGVAAAVGEAGAVARLVVAEGRRDRRRRVDRFHLLGDRARRVVGPARGVLVGVGGGDQVAVAVVLLRSAVQQRAVGVVAAGRRRVVVDVVVGDRVTAVRQRRLGVVVLEVVGVGGGVARAVRRRGDVTRAVVGVRRGHTARGLRRREMRAVGVAGRDVVEVLRRQRAGRRVALQGRRGDLAAQVVEGRLGLCARAVRRRALLAVGVVGGVGLGAVGLGDLGQVAQLVVEVRGRPAARRGLAGLVALAVVRPDRRARVGSRRPRRGVRREGLADLVADGVVGRGGDLAERVLLRDGLAEGVEAAGGDGADGHGVRGDAVRLRLDRRCRGDREVAGLVVVVVGGVLLGVRHGRGQAPLVVRVRGGLLVRRADRAARTALAVEGGHLARRQRPLVGLDVAGRAVHGVADGARGGLRAADGQRSCAGPRGGVVGGAREGPVDVQVHGAGRRVEDADQLGPGVQRRGA